MFLQFSFFKINLFLTSFPGKLGGHKFGGTAHYYQLGGPKSLGGPKIFGGTSDPLSYHAGTKFRLMDFPRVTMFMPQIREKRLNVLQRGQCDKISCLAHMRSLIRNFVSRRVPQVPRVSGTFVSLKNL